MYNISDTLTFPVGNLKIDINNISDNLIIAANDFYCSGILGYTVFLSAGFTRYVSKIALQKEPQNEKTIKKSVTGGLWGDAIDYKEENAFALCLPDNPNKYTAKLKDYTRIVELVNNTINESYHSVLLKRFIEAYPSKQDKVVCILPKHMIQLVSLGSFKGSAEDYVDVKEVVCALTYIAVGTEMNNKSAIAHFAGTLLIDWRLDKKEEKEEEEEYCYYDYTKVRAYLASQEYIEKAMSRIVEEYTGEIDRKDVSKYNDSNYRGGAVSNFSLGVAEEHINFNDFSFLNALSIIKSWEERRGVNLELDDLETDYYNARLKAPHIPDPF